MSFVNAVNSNQYDEISDNEISDDEISGFANTTKFPTKNFQTTNILATNFPPPDDGPIPKPKPLSNANSFCKISIVYTNPFRIYHLRVLLKYLGLH